MLSLSLVQTLPLPLPFLKPYPLCQPQAILPGGVRLVRAIARGERWPMSLGREVLAGLAGVPERADWKACGLGGDAEQAKAVEAFKEMFKAYDPTGGQ